MTKHEFDQQSATLCARMAASSNKATREQAARDAAALLEDLPAVLRNSPHCAREIAAMHTLIARVGSEEASGLTESTDGNWRVVSDGTLAVRVDFTHREKAVEYRLPYIEDHPWTGAPFQGADFVLDATDVWRAVNAWMDES